MAEAVKWGILSTADINRKVIPGAKASPKVELVAVASRTQDRADAYAREWEIERAYGSYDALLGDPEIEAVYISLPNTLHCEWSIRAVQAGKHVLCEKPLSRHTDDVESAFDAAERAGRLLSEAFMYRHNSQTKRLRELVDDGAIGELRLIRSAFSYGLYEQDNIRLRTDVEGGALMDVGCYNVSGSRLLGGEPERAFGEAWFGPSGRSRPCTSRRRGARRSSCRDRRKRCQAPASREPGPKRCSCLARAACLARLSSSRALLGGRALDRGERKLLIGLAREAAHADGADAASGFEDGDAAEEEREERVEARTLDGVVANLLRELASRAGVTPRRRVGLALRVQAGVRGGAVHRGRCHELAVSVRHEDGDGRRSRGDDVLHDRECSLQVHGAVIFAHS